MKCYIVSSGAMYVSGFKQDYSSGAFLYAKLNPLINFARLIEDKEVAEALAFAINGSVTCLEENEREALR